MIQGGQPVWDVVDITIEFLYSAAKDGLFEKIDPGVAHVDRIDPKFRHEYGLGDIVWSYNIAYSPIRLPRRQGATELGRRVRPEALSRARARCATAWRQCWRSR